MCGSLAVWGVVQLPGTICSACVKDTFQEPDRSQASLNNIWHLPYCSVLFILHGVRSAGVVKCLPYHSATLVE